MAAGGQRHLRAGEIDEYQIAGARQQVAGPVGCIGPHAGAGTAVPADAAADGAGIAEYLPVADGKRAVAARQRAAGEFAAKGAGRHDIGFTADCDVSRQFADHECAAQCGRTADDKCIGACGAAFDLQRAGRVLNVTTGDAERADRAGAARTHDAAVGEGLRAQCERAEAADRTGVARGGAGVAEGCGVEQLDRARIRERARHAQRTLSDGEETGLGEADIGAE